MKIFYSSKGIKFKTKSASEFKKKEQNEKEMTEKERKKQSC